MAAFVLASAVAVVAIGALVLGTGGARRSPVAKLPSAASAGVAADGATGGAGGAAQRASSGGEPGQENRERVEGELRQENPEQVDQALRQENPEQVDPALRREHDRLLAQRPAFQHLPYRDHAVGIGFDRVLPDGRLELLVSYLGSRARAVDDLHRLLARYGDPGTAYVERYRRVF